MIRYDWNILKDYPMYVTIQVLWALMDKENLVTYPKRVLKPISRFTDTTAFLLNPRKLITNREKYIDSELYLYLELAAMRSYINYKETGSCRLPTYYIEDKYDLNKLRMNTILDVTNEEIIFIYEET